MFAWLITAAFALPPQSDALVDLAFVHSRGAPYGVRLGVQVQDLVGDPCGFAEPTCRQAALWPIIGARGSVAWHGGSVFSADVSGFGGFGSAAPWDRGFVPDAELFAEVGWGGRIGAPQGLLIGGVVAKSLSPSFDPANASALALRFDVSTVFDFKTAPEPAWGIGPQLIVSTLTDFSNAVPPTTP